MTKNDLCLITLCAFLNVCQFSMSAQAASETIQLASPYQSSSLNQQQLSDRSKTILECVFNNMERSYQVTQTPWQRAKKHLSAQIIDGIITTMPYRETGVNAVLSAPLILEKWHWYFTANQLSEAGDTKNLRVGAINNSNQATWLKMQGYKNLTLVDSYQQLLRLSVIKRIDLFVASQGEIAPVIKQGNHADIKSKFLHYVPQGVYFSKQFLKSRKHFIRHFNKNVSQCAPEVIALLAREKLEIKRLVLPQLYRWLNNPLIQKTLIEQNSKHSTLNTDLITLLDEQWLTEIENNQYHKIKQILANPLSKFLRVKQQQANDLYTELFITDKLGLNAAMSQPTSDYWQGDENKYAQTLGKVNGSIYIDDIKYDDSTKKFQSQISIAIKSAEGDHSLGMLTVGVDVEKALSLDK